MVTPSGFPGWSRQNGHTLLGGHLNKWNLLGNGAVDPRTDLTAQNLCRIAEDLSQAVKMLPFAIVRVGSSGSVEWKTGMSEGESVNVSVTRLGVGFYRLTVGGSISDSYSVTHPVEIKYVTLTPTGSVGAICTYVLNSSTQVYVYMHDDTGALADIGFVAELD